MKPQPEPSKIKYANILQLIAYNYKEKMPELKKRMELYKIAKGTYKTVSIAKVNNLFNKKTP